ncbi:DUF1937 family protein [Roseicitreum antarcticum]|uniref:DUF1937 domain-containing protein n=1 Tax=Roseicitreum antarcticum TaxID=564137 RepID=A0A1H3FP94_9RHOB|nr:DUF1937 family protein [Roseicitreum antarcticum]SDX91959.1 protein of unknown function [Roseicitreum antarcticum]
MAHFPDHPAWPLLMAPGARHRVSPLVRIGCDLDEIARHAPAGIQYLATPFSRNVLGDDGGYCQTAGFDAAGRAGACARRLAMAGVTAISPVVQSVEMLSSRPATGVGADVPDPLDAAFWEVWCRPLLWACKSVIVADIAGWSASRGIWHEVVWALDRNMPVFVCADKMEVDDGLG